MSKLQNIIMEYGITPVLMDIGASGGTPTIWTDIASSSIYVGFDPDSREMRTISNGAFQKSTIVNKAVGIDPQESKTRFFLTKSPYCSSTLRPDSSRLENYIFWELFEVVREVEVPATTLNDVLLQQGLASVDWLKVDAQGTDLRIYRSISDSTRSKLMAIDTEPGLIDAYTGEDLFIDVHRVLCSEGFWLSRLDVRGTKRISKKTVLALADEQPDLMAKLQSEQQRISPGWCEARYLRSTQWLAAHAAPREEYILLWTFAVMDRQFGFALDVAREVRHCLGDQVLSATLTQVTEQFLRSSQFIDESTANDRPSRLVKLMSRVKRRLLG